MKLNHIGIIISDIEKSKQLYAKLGYTVDMIQNNRIIIMTSEDSVALELVKPINVSSNVINAHKGYHHICYEAESGEDIVQKFKEMKIGKIFTQPMIAPALDNRQVVFACLQNGTLIEFILP